MVVWRLKIEDLRQKRRKFRRTIEKKVSMCFVFCVVLLLRAVLCFCFVLFAIYWKRSHTMVSHCQIFTLLVIICKMIYSSVITWLISIARCCVWLYCCWCIWSYVSLLLTNFVAHDGRFCWTPGLDWPVASAAVGLPPSSHPFFLELYIGSLLIMWIVRGVWLFTMFNGYRNGTIDTVWYPGGTVWLVICFWIPALFEIIFICFRL
jgi:hypothetical protein